MTEFYSERTVKVRKPRPCEGCGKVIAAGEPALVFAGKFDGDFGCFTHHPECREAEIALNKLADTPWGEWYALSEIEPDSWDWLLADFPIVAARKNITQVRIDEYKAEQEACRLAFARRR